MTPDDRTYTKTHEWVKIDGDVAIVGITDHAQDALGDITFVELPTVGNKYEQGSECGVVESVKAASDIYAPIGGEIAEVNTDLEDRPELLNESPYQEGWIYKMKGFDPAQANALLGATDYDSMAEEA